MAAPAPPIVAIARGSADDIRSFFVSQIRLFRTTFDEKVYPAFADPEGDATRVADDHWNARMSEPGTGDEDPGSIADDAHELSLDFYFTQTAMQFTVVNLFTAGLYHLFEQQVVQLLRRWSVAPGSRAVDTARGILTRQYRLNLGTAASWSRLQQLEHLANVVKHAEGPSAVALRGSRPELFALPMFRRPELRDLRSLRHEWHRPVTTPLTGEDLYVTKEDFDLYALAVLEFWEWLATEFDRHSPQAREI